MKFDYDSMSVCMQTELIGYRYLEEEKRLKIHIWQKKNLIGTNTIHEKAK